MQTCLLIYVMFVLCEQLISYSAASLTDLALLSDGYEIGDYLASHQYQDSTPWIVSNAANADYIEQNSLPTINVDYPSLGTLTNHLGSTNHATNQFGNTFIPSTEDKALNSLLNSKTILTQNNPVVQIANHDIEDSADHIHIDSFSNHKPFGGHKKQPILSGNTITVYFWRIFPLLLFFCCLICDIMCSIIVSVQHPINLDVSPHSLFVSPISHAHIYPMRIPNAKTTIIKKIVSPVPYYTEKLLLPYHSSDRGIALHKKPPPIFVNFPTIKSVVFHRTN